jgi:hypothetical protein
VQTLNPSASGSGADGVPINPISVPLESISWISSDELRFAGWPLTVARSNTGEVRFGSAAKPAFVPLLGAGLDQRAVADGAVGAGDRVEVGAALSVPWS